MKFAIERTSDQDRKNRPCKGAFLDGVDDLGRQRWCIEIESLDQLIGLAERNMNANEIVIVNPSPVTDLPMIEIYDAYRE